MTIGLACNLPVSFEEQICGKLYQKCCLRLLWKVVFLFHFGKMSYCFELPFNGFGKSTLFNMTRVFTRYKKLKEYLEK